MSDLKKTSIYLAGALLLVGASLTAYVFLFLSMKGTIEAANETSLRAEDFENAQSKLSRTLAFLEEYANAREMVGARFIKESEIVSFARQIEMLGPQSSTTLSIESLEPGTNARKEPVLNFRIKAEGSFAGVMRLVELLENYPARFEFSSIRFARADGSASTPAREGVKTSAAVSTRWELTVAITASNFIKE